MSSFTSLISGLHLAEFGLGQYPMPYFMAGKMIQTNRLSKVLTVRDRHSRFHLDAPYIKKYDELLPFPDFCKSQISQYIPCYEKVAFALKAKGLWKGETSYGIMKLMWLPLDLEENITSPFLLMFDHKVYHFGEGEPEVCIRIIRNNIEIVCGSMDLYYNDLLRPCQDIHGLSLDEQIWEMCQKFPKMSNGYVEKLLEYTPYTKHEKSVRKRRAYFALKNHLMKKPHNICATDKEKREMIKALSILPLMGVTEDDKFMFSEPLEISRAGKMISVPIEEEVERRVAVKKIIKVPEMIRQKKMVNDMVLEAPDGSGLKTYSNADSLPRHSLKEVYSSWMMVTSCFRSYSVFSKDALNKRRFQTKDSRGIWLFDDKELARSFDEGNNVWLGRQFDFQDEAYNPGYLVPEEKRDKHHMGFVRFVADHYKKNGPPSDLWDKVRKEIESKYPGFTYDGYHELTPDYSKMKEKEEVTFEKQKVWVTVGHEEMLDPTKGPVNKVKPNPKWPEELVELSYKPGFSVIRTEYFPYKRINEAHKEKLDTVLHKYRTKKRLGKARVKICEERQEYMKNLKVLDNKAVDEMIKKNAEMMFANPDILLPENTDKLLKSIRAGGFSWKAAKRLRVAVIAMVNHKDAYSVLEEVVHRRYRSVIWHRKRLMEQWMADY